MKTLKVGVSADVYLLIYNDALYLFLQINHTNYLRTKNVARNQTKDKFLNACIIFTIILMLISQTNKISNQETKIKERDGIFNPKRYHIKFYIMLFSNSSLSKPKGK